MPDDHREQPPQRLMTPIALAVACPDEQVLLWAVVVDDLGVEMSAVEVADLSAVARVTLPAAILISEDVFAFDRPVFERIASDCHCPLIVMSTHCFDEATLRGRLGPAVVAWRARRHRARSGIRHKMPTMAELLAQADAVAKKG